ncbi:MAG TPA: hypothetical protein VFP42_05925, partial [Acidimicrobiia bacterium]|nr:hypothetical protein [Acidimicrobiia bacterium]
GVPLRYLVGTSLVLLGMIVGLGVGRWVEVGNGDAAVTYFGPSVERSLAMERSHVALEGWGRAQAAALDSAMAATYVGPSVERSLAMERSHDALERSGRAQAATLGSAAGSGIYEGSSVERSLAMERSHDVLEEWGKTHARLLAAENS